MQEIEFDQEDHTLGSLLQQYLLNNKNVLFAAYNVPHPLVKKFKLTYMLKDPKIDSYTEEIRNIIRDLDTIEKDFKNLVKNT